MSEKRGRGRDVASEVVEEVEGFVNESMDEKPSIISVSTLSESQLARIRLRERWELASVLNFLHVFKPVIRVEIEISAEEIETALITPNNALAQLHISLLKGIPPISKNLAESDAWVTEVFKKLATWWPWVAEGEIPVVASHGEEIPRYKELDPIIRLVILKALCEVRAEQDDVLSYINDELKKGTQISNFRKDMIAEDGNGTAYWYDGDSDIGYRLYREVNKVEFVRRVKGKGLGKGRLTQPTNNFQWETLATNLEDFLQISKKLSSSEVAVEAAVGKVVENEIIPVLEKLQKKKERALKRQQRQTMLLSGPLNPYKIVNTRSQRSRRPVSYTFDEYDRSIDEAIQLYKKSKTGEDERKHGQKDGEHGGRSGVSSHGSTAYNTGLVENDADDYKFRGGSEGEDDDIDYDGKNNDDAGSGGNSTSSEKENRTLGNETRQRAHSKKPKGHFPPRDVVGLRRSTRTTGHTTHPNLETRNHVDRKKMLRQRPTPNTVPDRVVIPDSEDENSSGNTSNKILGAEKNSLAVLDGLLDESEEENEGNGLPRRN